MASHTKKTLVAIERSEELRRQFINELAPYLQTPARLVFLDECGFNAALTSGQVIILDNLSSLRRMEVKTLIEERGCTLLFLPLYSPDLNPIEMMFSKLKAWIQARSFRQTDTLIQGFWDGLEMVSLQDIFGWIAQDESKSKDS